MAPGHLDPGKPRLYGCIGWRKPAKTGSSDAVSTGNALQEKKFQRRREALRLILRCPRHYPLRLTVTRAHSYDTALSSSLIARAIRSYMQLIAAIVKMSSTRFDGPIGNTYEFAITAIVPFLPPEGVYKRPLSRYLNRFQGQKQPLAVLAQG